MAGADEKRSVRDRVLAAVARYPGLHLRALERELGESAALLQYHLRKLESEGLVEAQEHGGYVRYHPAGPARERLAAADERRIGLLRERVPLHIVLILLDRGPQTHGELVAATSLAKSTVSYHLAKLADEGLVQRVAGTGQLRVHDPDRVRRLLRTHKPTPDLLDRFAQLWEDLYGS